MTAVDGRAMLVAREANALGHVGLMLGMLGLILVVSEFYTVVAPYGNIGGVLFFPLLAWALGLLFVVGEWFEAKRTP